MTTCNKMPHGAQYLDGGDHAVGGGFGQHGPAAGLT